MEHNELFNPGQHGFRLGRSCLSQLIAHYGGITQMLGEGQSVTVVYLDFAKAFDKVDFLMVMKKLQYLGISGNMGRWIHSFLTSRTQTVIVNGVKFEHEEIKSGVPQASVLGSLLFLVLPGYIDKNVATSFTFNFADDTRATKGIMTLEDTQVLQTDFDPIYGWAEQNNIMFKFECLHYGRNSELKTSTGYRTMSGDQVAVPVFIGAGRRSCAMFRVSGYLGQ